MGDRKRLVVFIFVCILVTAVFETWVFTRPPELRIRVLRLHLTMFISAFMLLCITYIWKRLNVLFRSNHLLYPGTIFKLLMLVLMIMAQSSAVLLVLLVRTEPYMLSVISSFCFGSILFMTICMVLGDISSFFLRKVLCNWRSRDSEMAKAEVKIRVLLSLIGALLLIATGSYFVRSLAIERVTVPVKGLNPYFNGTTIVQVSDIHLGAFNGKSRLEGIVKLVNSIHGDIVVITGDLVDGTVFSLKEAVTPLGHLHTKHGVYFVTGRFNRAVFYS